MAYDFHCKRLQVRQLGCHGRVREEPKVHGGAERAGRGVPEGVRHLHPTMVYFVHHEAVVCIETRFNHFFMQTWVQVPALAPNNSLTRPSRGCYLFRPSQGIRYTKGCWDSIEDSFNFLWILSWMIFFLLGPEGGALRAQTDGLPEAFCYRYNVTLLHCHYVQTIIYESYFRPRV